MDRHQQTFLEEARELLSDLEDALLAIEQTPDDADLIGRIFRVMHTVKGSSAMFGYTAIAEFAHELENAFDSVREGHMRVTPALITLTLCSRDHIALLLDSAEAELPADPRMLQGGERILEKLRTLMPAPADAPLSSPPALPANATASSGRPAMLYRIRFVPAQNIYLTGSNPQYLIDEVKELGECDVILHSDGMPPPDQINPDLCYYRWDLLLSTDREEQTVRDVFIFVEDTSEIRIEPLGEARRIDRDQRRELVEALQERDNVPLQRLMDIVIPPVHVPTPAADVQGQPREAGRQEHKTIQSIKVPAERLDSLVNLVGELVTIQARLTQFATSAAEPALLAIAEHVESLVWELRDNAMSMRMLPIGTTFGKFRRLVRDLSGELHKEIELATEGEETELDKTVIERLGDPLVHMIRNSVDHGIETPEERLAAGKPRVGMIRLTAAHVGTMVHISIADDGRGLDTEAIRQKAIATGLLTADNQPTETELFAMIFQAGFSTARTVTSVSGRGVGMDVVRRGIEELGGQIGVQSIRGKGTTVTLRIPLTLAIVEGLLVEVAGDSFILPLAIVRECVELTAQGRQGQEGDDWINVRGEIVPYIRLRHFYDKPGARPSVEYVVIVETNKMVVGFAVDAILGQLQTVIKTMGTMYRDVKGVSGATILGNGSVALIVDVPTIVDQMERRRLPGLVPADGGPQG